MGFAATALRMASGVIVWALHFAAIYGITALACARAAPPAASRTALIGVALATLAAVALLLPIMVAGWRRRQQFEWCFASAVAAFALLAVVWETLPAVIWGALPARISEAMPALGVPACG